MTTASQTWTEQTIEVAGARIQLMKGGTGPPLLVLHDEMGNAGWLPAYEALAAGHTVYVPSHPGFDGSQRLDWIATVRDLACWYIQALDALGLGSVPVVGCSFGGWLAAEIAAICPHRFTVLVLAAPPGIKPLTGEIFDMFLVTTDDYLQRCFASETAYTAAYGGEVTPEEQSRRERAREETCRLTWRPYMRDPALSHLLAGIKAKTLILWGSDDAIVPTSTGEAYKAAIPGAQLVMIDGCGHLPHIERQAEFNRLIDEFLEQ